MVETAPLHSVCPTWDSEDREGRKPSGQGGESICNKRLNNAIKFTPEGGTVSIRSSDSNDRFQIGASETGIGRTPAAFPSATEQTGREERAPGGDLAIGADPVRMQEQTVEPSSAKSAGSTTLPSTASSTTPGESPAPAAEAAPEIRILLVDDHVDTSKVMKMLLERRGYKVRTADSVGSALAEVRGEEFDLMISDIGLPDGSGLDLMRTIKAEGRDLKAVALSGFGMEEDIRRSMEAGFHEHLTKPVGVQKLQEVIHRLLA